MDAGAAGYPGVPVREAAARWTPAELWQRYAEIADHEIPMLVLDERDGTNLEARALRGEIERLLTAKLRSGELIASGLFLPLQPASRRGDVAAVLWSRLQLDIRKEEASGDGLHVVELLVRQADPPASKPATLAQPGARRPPGRPSIMPLIEAEMRRRAASGMIEESLGREAKVLALWAQQQFADAHVPKPDSIERKLRRIYKELKRTKRPDK